MINIYFWSNPTVLSILKILAGVILEVLVEAFPETFSKEAQEAWSKLMGVVYRHVRQVYEEIGWTSVSSAAE